MWIIFKRKKLIDHINCYLSFLFDDYHFSIKNKNTDNFFSIENQYVGIDIIIDRGRLHITLYPVEKEYRILSSQGYKTKRVGVAFIADCLQPPFPFHKMKNIKKGFKEISIFMREYLPPLLEGDFSQWQFIDACAEKYRSEIRKKYIEKNHY